MPLLINKLANSAIDIHCHGIGEFDFTALDQIDLAKIEHILAIRNHYAILTMYLHETRFAAFLNLLEKFHQGKKLAKYQHILGFGLEGPLLSSCGGTPHDYIWQPSKRQWQQLVACGKQGLIYNIFSPDVEFLKHKSNSHPNNITWLVETLLDGGVLPAVGHITKNVSNIQNTAIKLQLIYDIIAYWGYGATITDHLYNDMPLNFRHAWRTPAVKMCRNKDIKNLNLSSWSSSNLEEKLGLIPATIIKYAKKGLVKIAMNFDGEHVDLAIVKKTVEIVGAENLIMMTDSIESKMLANKKLTQLQDSTLLYQDENIVAAGSQNIASQIKNMQLIGLTAGEIKLITQLVAQQILDKREKFINDNTHFSKISE